MWLNLQKAVWRREFYCIQYLIDKLWRLILLFFLVMVFFIRYLWASNSLLILNCVSLNSTKSFCGGVVLIAPVTIHNGLYCNQTTSTSLHFVVEPYRIEPKLNRVKYSICTGFYNIDRMKKEGSLCSYNWIFFYFFLW